LGELFAVALLTVACMANAGPTGLKGQTGPTGPRIVFSDEYEPGLRRNLQAIAEQAWDIVQEKFGGAPPPFDHPLYCHIAKDDLPRTEPGAYQGWIGIALVRQPKGQDTKYDEYVYELGHEFGHVMLDPRPGNYNGVIETLCMALSHEVLDKMADKWQKGGEPFPWLHGYGIHFHEFRINTENRWLLGVPEEMRSSVKKGEWGKVRQYLIEHRSELLDAGNRSTHALGAAALEAKGIRWKTLHGFAGCKKPVAKGEVDYLQPCLGPLNGSLCPMGEGCVGSRRGRGR
jgi:hypothetical protein